MLNECNKRELLVVVTIKFTAWHSTESVKRYARYKMIGNVTGKMNTGAIVMQVMI